MQSMQPEAPLPTSRVAGWSKIRMKTSLQAYVGSREVSLTWVSTDRWEHEHQHELAVGDELAVGSVGTIVDIDGKLPESLFPFLITWKHAYEDEHQSVFAVISQE